MGNYGGLIRGTVNGVFHSTGRSIPFKNQGGSNGPLGNDGNGSLSGGTVGTVAGLKILKTNHIPTTDITKAAGDKSSLGDGSLEFEGTNAKGPVALCYHKSALATVKLRALKVEAERRIERQGHLVVAGYAMGHDILRHEGLVELAF